MGRSEGLLGDLPMGGEWGGCLETYLWRWEGELLGNLVMGVGMVAARSPTYGVG